MYYLIEKLLGDSEKPEVPPEVSTDKTMVVPPMQGVPINPVAQQSEAHKKAIEATLEYPKMMQEGADALQDEDLSIANEIRDRLVEKAKSGEQLTSEDYERNEWAKNLIEDAFAREQDVKRASAENSNQNYKNYVEKNTEAGLPVVSQKQFEINNYELDKITDAASGIDKDEVDKDLDPEDDSKVQDMAENIVSRIDGGESPSEAIRKESSLLGDLFGNKNIQRALVYYLGARLMGYSGSGSGMAAGQVLLSGMEADAKAEKLRLKSEAEAAAKNAIDMSKVVTMVDHKGNFVESYVSPNGKFFRPVNAPENVAYQVSTSGHRLSKSGEEDRNTRIIKASEKVRDKFKPAIIDELEDLVKSDARPEGYEQQNIDIAKQMFSEAGISDQLVSNLVDSYGLEYLESPTGQQALREAMGQLAREVASGGVVNIASAQGQFDRMMMKAAKVNLPREIYMLKGNMASSDAQNKLSNRIRDVNAVRSQALERLYARKDLTATQVRQEEVRINKLVRFENVFEKAYKDFNNRKSNEQFNDYWTRVATNNKSTPFIEWITDTTGTGKEFNSFFSLVGKDENYFNDLLGLNKKATKKE
jgi:hypothetical protein|tara:strand:+ start:11747 stop:13513 length:1767 start_codon:yes stop_codon:yes gene_type:complete